MRKGSAIVRAFASKSIVQCYWFKDVALRADGQESRNMIEYPAGERYELKGIVYLTRYTALEAPQLGKLLTGSGYQTLFQRVF
jgi:hypothetical protein